MSPQADVVDVVAIFDEMIDCYGSTEECPDDTAFIAEAKKARAAVAGLIERERMMRAALEDLRRQCANNLEVGATGPGYWTDAQETIDAALSAATPAARQETQP